MPKTYNDPEKLFELNGRACWHTYKSGCGLESDRKLSYHYTLDLEQVEPDMGSSNWFDVRNLPMYAKYDGDHWPVAEGNELLKHALIIMAQLADNPEEIPHGSDFVEVY